MRTIASALRTSLRSPGLRAFCACLLLASLATPLLADDQRICDRQPFDRVILDKENKDAVLDVEQLNLPEYRVQAQGNLTIRLLVDPTRPYVVDWEHITQVMSFEQILMSEARRLSDQGEFDEAFDYYARLLRDYPSMPGVEDAANDYLRSNAAALVKSQRYDRALAVLLALYARQPEAQGLRDGVDAVCTKMIEEKLRAKDFAAARAVLSVWQEKFRELNSSTAAAWDARFATAARRQVDEARQHIANKDFLAARLAIGRARDIRPDMAEARELWAEIQRINPSVAVGVFETSPHDPVRRIDDWAALRASRLLAPPIDEMVGFGSEGGVYKSPYGRWIPDERGTRMSLQLATPATPNDKSAPSADFLARFFLHMADPTRPEYSRDFAALLAGVSVEGTGLVHLDWQRPHVRPEALLQLPLTRLTTDEKGRTTDELFTPPPWTVAESQPDRVVFNATPVLGAPAPRLRTIFEQTMPDDQAAVAALVHGDIDVLDRVPPWQIERLRKAKDIRVEKYELPTVHVLLLNPDKPLSRQREFRRALCYAIPRERIVKQVLLGGAELPGFTVLSGPFPAGTSFSDPLRYAYNNRIEPRPFEPRLAAVLASVAWTKVLDPTGKSKAKENRKPLPQLVLAHPADPVARVACEAIQVQLANVGIPTKLVEFTSDELLAGKVQYDLRYAELAVWEPVVDARALFGPGGLAGGLASAYLTAALTELDHATNWRDVRAKLAEIHDIAHHDLPLVPLWQTVNYFAYRTSLHGIGQKPITLYQNVDEWRMGDDGAVADSSAKP